MLQTDSSNELKAVLAERGLEAAIALLNSRTECQFTSLFRFDGPMLRALTFYDRANPTADAPEDIPIEASYCVFVRESDRPFLVEDALNDLRVLGHPKCREIQSYYGVPVKDGNGITLGTLCLFDVHPVTISGESVRLLEEFAELLRQKSPTD